MTGNHFVQVSAAGNVSPRACEAQSPKHQHRMSAPVKVALPTKETRLAEILRVQNVCGPPPGQAAMNSVKRRDAAHAFATRCVHTHSMWQIGTKLRCTLCFVQTSDHSVPRICGCLGVLNVVNVDLAQLTMKTDIDKQFRRRIAFSERCQVVFFVP